MSPNIFVIIVTYNGRIWYDRCFTSLRLSSVPVQTIIIDNASTDDTIDYLGSNYPELIMLKSESNLGFGQGNNKGLRYAIDNDADYAFLLNQDAWIEPDTIKKLVEIHNQNNEYGVISPIHLNGSKTKLESTFTKFITPQYTHDEFVSDMYTGFKKEVYETRFINAAAWLISRECIEKVGGFDPLFFHYAEDDNYCHRAMYHGLKIGISPSTSICHDTENRKIEDKYIAEAVKRRLLLSLTNINNPDALKNLHQFIIKEFFKTGLYLLTFRYKKMKRSWGAYKYVWVRKRSLRNSIVTNKIQGKHYLNSSLILE